MSPRLRGPAVRIVQAGLALIIAVVALASLLPAVLGPNGLDLARGTLPLWPPQPNMHFKVDPSPEVIYRVLDSPDTQLLEWESTANGTVDAATGLPPVETSWANGWLLSILGPDWVDHAWYALPMVASSLMLIGVLVLAFRIVGSIRAEGFASRRNSQRLLAMAIIVGLGGSLVQAAEIVGHRIILDRSAAAGLFEIQWSFSFTPLLAGMILLMCSHVVRRNAELQEEVAGLV